MGHVLLALTIAYFSHAGALYGGRWGAGFEHGHTGGSTIPGSMCLEFDRLQVASWWSGDAVSTALLVIGRLLKLLSAMRPYLATLDVVEFERHVSGPGDELARNEHQVVDTQ